MKQRNKKETKSVQWSKSKTSRLFSKNFVITTHPFFFWHFFNRISDLCTKLHSPSLLSCDSPMSSCSTAIFWQIRNLVDGINKKNEKNVFSQITQVFSSLFPTHWRIADWTVWTRCHCLFSKVPFWNNSLSRDGWIQVGSMQSIHWP